jgi:hypothetical protein
MPMLINDEDPLLVDPLEEFEKQKKKPCSTYKFGWFLITTTNTSKYQSIYQGFVPTQLHLFIP